MSDAAKCATAFGSNVLAAALRLAISSNPGWKVDLMLLPETSPILAVENTHRICVDAT